MIITIILTVWIYSSLMMLVNFIGNNEITKDMSVEDFSILAICLLLSIIIFPQMLYRATLVERK